MAKQAGPKKRVGRPSKGDRHTFVTRVPQQDSLEVQAIAHQRGWSYSETIAELVRIALRHRDELGLTKAS